MARARPERTKGFDGLPSVLGGWPTLPAFGRVGVLTSFPEKANPPASRKPRGIGHPQLHPRLKGPTTRHRHINPDPLDSAYFRA